MLLGAQAFAREVIDQRGFMRESLIATAQPAIHHFEQTPRSVVLRIQFERLLQLPLRAIVLSSGRQR
jgi:hypothetical protein